MANFELSAEIVAGKLTSNAIELKTQIENELQNYSVEKYLNDPEAAATDKAFLNKVKEAVSFFDCIQSVDRIELAEKLSKEMQVQNKNIPVYIQVNTGSEPQKGGLDIEKESLFLYDYDIYILLLL